VALDASLGTLGNFELGQRREEARGGPTLLIGTGGELLPETADGGQAQLVQQQRQRRTRRRWPINRDGTV